jgi:HPt (histidine-containing phosphotransfer) domain-containing protein
MTEAMSTFLEALQRHRTAYLLTLPGRLAELEALARRLEDPAQLPATLAGLERCAHALAGSAGTFGLADLGASARALELEVEDTGGDCAATDAILHRVQDLRQELLEALAYAEAAAESP